MSVAEMALGASNPSQRMVHLILCLRGCALVYLCSQLTIFVKLTLWNTHIKTRCFNGAVKVGG
jgi:hypothetical protein